MNQNEKDRRDVEVITAADGHRIVVIHDIRFHGKRHIRWGEVESYLKELIGSEAIIHKYAEKIYIGADFPGEFAWSEYSKRLKGALAKAKANSSQGIIELISVADNQKYIPDHGGKHKRKAKNGWYRYDIRFALPVYENDIEIARYNVYRARMVVRYSANGRKYLYDIINIQKEKTSKPFKL